MEYKEEDFQVQQVEKYDKNSANKWCIMGETFELPDRFKVTEYLGAGAYGVVCAAWDKKNQKLIAIKKCKNIFQTRTLARRTLREMRLLR